MSSYSRQQLEDWLKTIDVKAGAVLDVGGSQLPIKGRTKSWDVEGYRILDLAFPHEIKQKTDIIADINHRESDLSKYYGVFDVAFCLEVTEYLWNPVEAFDNIRRMLKQGGILYLSSHFVYCQHNPAEFDYLRYTPAGIEKILEMAGFEIIEHKKRTSDYLPEYYVYDKMKMSKDNNINHNDIGSLIKAKKL